MSDKNMKRTQSYFRQTHEGQTDPRLQKPLWENTASEGSAYAFADAYASDSDREMVLCTNFGEQASNAPQISPEEREELLKKPVWEMSKNVMSPQGAQDDKEPRELASHLEIT